MNQFKIIFFLILFFSVSSASISARTYEIAEISPQKTDFNAYLSYQHNLLLISFINKEKKSFDCLPNRYVFYDLKRDYLYEEKAGNIIINSDFSQYIKTQIHSLGKPVKKNKKIWKKNVQTLINTMDISSATLDKGKLTSSKSQTQCWQQPILKQINHKQLKALPYLMANMCDGLWCSDMYWSGKSKIRFWAHIDPNLFHLIELNLSSNEFKFLKKTPKFIQKEKIQENAPRQKLVNLKKVPQKSISLPSANDSEIKLNWKKTKTGTVKVSLSRNKRNSIRSSQLLPSISNHIKNKKIPQAIQLIQFALWLDPKNSDAKIERLKTLAELLLYKEFFNYLTSVFSYNEKIKACQKIHISKDFQNIRKLKSFPKHFKRICF